MARLSYFLFSLVASAIYASAAEHPLVIDLAQSRVEIDVHATADSFAGKLARFDPFVAVDDNDQIASARFAFKFADIATGKDKRDRAMHAWQSTEKFPDGVFVMDALEAAPAPGSGMMARGKLTLHGVTREIRFPVTVQQRDGVFVIDGNAIVDTREYGLPIIRMAVVLKVDPLVRVHFHLQGQKGS